MTRPHTREEVRDERSEILGRVRRGEKAALKMAAKLSAKEKGLMVRALHCDMKDEAEHDQTWQRAFEQTMLSLDRPAEDGNLYDYGDCGRAAKRIFRKMDAE